MCNFVGAWESLSLNIHCFFINQSIFFKDVIRQCRISTTNVSVCGMFAIFLKTFCRSHISPKTVAFQWYFGDNFWNVRKCHPLLQSCLIIVRYLPVFYNYRPIHYEEGFCQAVFPWVSPLVLVKLPTPETWTSKYFRNLCIYKLLFHYCITGPVYRMFWGCKWIMSGV